MSFLFVVKKGSFEVEKIVSLLKETDSSLSVCGSGELNGHLGVLLHSDRDCEDLKTELQIKEEFSSLDLLVMEQVPSLKQRGIVVLDMDMTSVQIEGIDEIARRLGVFDRVSEITSKAMHGGLDFASSLKARVALLKDGSASVIEDVKAIMTETDGLEALMKTATAAGWLKGICSGGFTQLIHVLEEKYRLDMVNANTLEIADGRFTGAVAGRIVDAEVKKEGVLKLAAKHAIPKEQIIVLGDGANDLKMIETAGLGIAYHAKPIVQAKAPCALNCSDLTAVALLLTLGANANG